MGDIESIDPNIRLQTSATTTTRLKRKIRLPRLALFGRCCLLIAAELGATLALWIAALALFAPDQDRRRILSLCLIAWTLGLRHGLDMDHIVAIDNVTRNLVAMGQLPITCGLFFSIGHSSIVVGVTIAIIISVSSIEKIPNVASIGGVIGVSVSASFLLILAVINSVVLYRALKSRRDSNQDALLQSEAPADTQLSFDPPPPVPTNKDDVEGLQKKESNTSHGMMATTCMARLIKPIFMAIDRPWKMYPVGILFGFGFDTSSEIALLGVSALAKTGEHPIPNSDIIILPLLFTAGMSFVDSLDSVFMLHAYALPVHGDGEGEGKSWWRRLRFFEPRDMGVEAKLLTVQIVLTVISIAIALLIAIIEFMGLAAEKCTSCAEAAENDPGLSGRWWRFWIAVNDNSGYLGAGVVGIFVIVVGGWGISSWYRKRKARSADEASSGENVVVA
ncbi:NicO-domain-containing protein [Meredithblackwellia eburnea MCA 4105]